MDITSLATLAIVLVLATTTLRTLSIVDRLLRLVEKAHRKDRARRK